MKPSFWVGADRARESLLVVQMRVNVALMATPSSINSQPLMM